MNFLRGVMGAPSAGPQPSGAETIQKLCDRVASSTLLDDRRDAVRALKSLSKVSVFCLSSSPRIRATQRHLNIHCLQFGNTGTLA
uniref:Uncharacterized protein n=1 Tax=Sphenodon punctatus TaxID=8508 RepID=A0A8D0GY30_SPHPU